MLAGLLLLPHVAMAVFVCTGDNQMFTDMAACQSSCTQKITCTTGTYSVAGNSILGESSFNRIVWGETVVPNLNNVASAGTHNAWIDFQVAEYVTGNIITNTVASGVSGGKITWSQNVGDPNIITFASAVAPAQPKEIISNFRAIVGVSQTGKNVLNFLSVNGSTGLPEIIGSIPINGGAIFELIDGTIFDTDSNKYVEISRVATDASNKSIIFFGRNFKGNEIRVALVTIATSGNYSCPIAFDVAGNPAVYTCDASNICSPPGTCNEAVGTVGKNPNMCAVDINKDGLVTKDEYKQCQPGLKGVSNVVGNFTATQACPIEKQDCDISCPSSLAYALPRDRCEESFKCASGTYNPGTQQCEVAAQTDYSCPSGGVLSGTTCITPQTYPAYTYYINQQSCPSGGVVAYDTSGNIIGCDTTTPYNAGQFFFCNNGDILNGNTCNHQVSYTATLTQTCPTGFSISNNSANATCGMPPCPSCPLGSILSNGVCVVSPDIPAEVTYSCPTGTLIGSQCNTTSSTSPVTKYVCPTKGELTGTDCKITTEYDSTSTSSCPIGTTLSGSQCLTPSYSATVAYGCNPGDTLTGTNCSHTTPTTYGADVVCSLGDTLSGTTCTHTASSSSTSNATYSCTAGDTLSGTTCTHSASSSVTYTATYSCTAGDALSGTNCTHSVASSYGAIATYSCTAGDTLSGTNCVHSVTNSYGATGLCNAGDTLSGTSCVHAQSTATTYNATTTCTSGDTLSGTSCAHSTTSTTDYGATTTCTAGDMLSGTTCTHTASSATTYPLTYSCEPDYTLVGNTCVTTTKYNADYTCYFGTDIVNYIGPNYVGNSPSSSSMCMTTVNSSITYTTPLSASCPRPHSTLVWEDLVAIGQQRPVCVLDSSYIATFNSCTAGDTLSGTTCTHNATSTSTYNATTTCTVGDSLNSDTSICTHTNVTTSNYNATTTCTAGDTLSGTTCTHSASSSSTYSPNYSCTSGDNLSGATCINTLSNTYGAVASYACTGVDTLSGTTCIHTNSSLYGATLGCPVGGTLSGTTCTTASTAMNTYGATLVCPVGDTLSGTTCTHNTSSDSTYSATYACTAGDLLAGSTCTNSSITNYVANTGYSCPTGGSVNGTNCDIPPTSVTITNTCPNGGTLSGTKCITEVTYPADQNHACTSGAMNNGSCSATGSAPANSTYFCATGILVGKKCNVSAYFNPSSAVPVSTIYSCPSGMLLTGTDCVATATIDATLTNTCPKGGQLVGKMCSSTSNYDATLTYICPSGMNLTGTQCNAPSYDATTYNSCNSGDTLLGASCRHSNITSYAGTPYCSTGDSMGGTTCTHTDVTTSNYNATYICNTIDILNGASCKHTDNISSTYGAILNCNSGDTLLGTTCTKTATSVYNASGNCAPGYTLTGSNCTKTITIASYYAPPPLCNSGDVLTGNTCTHYFQVLQSTITATSTCNKGDTFSTMFSMCTHTALGVISLYSGRLLCPTNYVLSGYNCNLYAQSLTTYTATPGSCNSGDTLTTGGVCSHTTTTVDMSGAIFSCNLGDTLSGTTCTHTAITNYNSTPYCTSPDTLNGSTCTHITSTSSNYNATPICTNGDTLSGATCTHSVPVDTIYPVLYSCNSGDTSTGSGCANTVYSTYLASSSYFCPSGGVLNGTKCDFAPIDATKSYTCPSGGTRTETICTLTTEYIPSPTYTCGTGQLDNQICTTVTTIPATVTNYCPLGNLSGNICIISVQPVTKTFDPVNMVCFVARALSCPGSPSASCFDTSKNYPPVPPLPGCLTGDIPIDSTACAPAKPGNNHWQCSPYDCHDITAPGETVTNDPDSSTTDSAGAKNEDGVCLDTIEIFSGSGKRCRTHGFLTGGMNCCDINLSYADATQNSRLAMVGNAAGAVVTWVAGWWAGAAVSAVGVIAAMILKCDNQDIKTVRDIAKGKCHYVDNYCTTKWPWVGCVQRAKGHCCFDSMLSRIIQEQGRPMISTFNPNRVQMTDPLTTGVAPNIHYRGTDQNIPSQGWLPAGEDARTSNLICRGFTLEEFTLVDFGNIQLDEWAADMVSKIQDKIKENVTNATSDIQIKVQNSLDNLIIK